ncbi:hypothetical protein F4782DRAFT_485593 [Xylaria castorea]|nr:hypothetical protein F4782DRAFT_485593 [Xylaria castorea]
MLPYSSLRVDNVLCIRLCATGKSKRNSHKKKLKLVCRKWMTWKAAERGLGTGYGQSKWASEFLMGEAGRREGSCGP